MSDIRDIFAAIANKAPRKERVTVQLPTVDEDGEQTLTETEIIVYFRDMRAPDYASVIGLSDLPRDEQFKRIPGLLARFMCRKDGTQIYDPENPEDYANLTTMNVETLNALSNAMNNVKGEKKDKGGTAVSPAEPGTSPVHERVVVAPTPVRADGGDVGH